MQLDVKAVAAARLRARGGQDPDGNGLRAAGPDSRPAAAGSAPDRAAAVSALYAEHALGLIRLAHIMLGSPSMAEDVVQDAFCGLYRRWPYLNDPAKALGYVRSSVLNGCRSARRLRPTVELEESHQAPARSAEAAILTAEERQHILRALRGLPPRQREVLALRFYLDLSDDEIALAMGIGKGSIRSAAHRGLISLRRILEETP